MTIFLRVLEAAVDDKPAELLRAITALYDLGKRNESFQHAVFEREPMEFSAVPRSPFAYWVSRETTSLFTHLPPLQAADGTRRACAGAVTNANDRFVRLSWEQSRGMRWVPFAKGGAFSKFYSDVYLLLNWAADGKELKTFVTEFRSSHGWSAHWAAELHNASTYFRPGLTWPLRTLSGLGMRALPPGSIFGHKGPAIVVSGDSSAHLLSLLAITASKPFAYLVDLHMTAASYEVGVIQRTPVPDLTEADTSALAQLARRAWSLKRTLDTTHETSHAFLLPSEVRARHGAFDPAAIHAELARVQAEIDDHAFRLYCLANEDRVEIERWASRGQVPSARLTESDSDGRTGGAPQEAEVDNNEESVGSGCDRDTMLSWLVGVAYGRFDLRLAIGDRVMPSEPEPFDPLPLRSPGMWPEAESPNSTREILVDDEGHPDDLASQVRTCAEQTAWNAPENLRAWLAREFFPLRIKMYSKSRRKAPIYWQLSTPSASYSVWLYIHAFTKDTLFRVQNDYVGGERGKLTHEQRRLESMAQEQSDKATAAARKALAAQEELVEELRAFLDEVKRVAPVWNPDLDDGVVINFAPLWRLVPHNKSWQKELKLTWDALCEGTYDWAHLAMHLWPERVVPKCATDRSLAIAHGLEDLFWIEGSDGKWTARKTPTRAIDDLVRERTSPAVKAALRSLLEADAVVRSARGGASKRKKR